MIDFDDPFDRLPAGDFFVLSGPAGELAEQKLDAFVKHVSDQRALARAGDAGDAAPHAQGNFDVEIFQIMRFGAADGEPLGFFQFALGAKTFALGAQVGAGGRIGIGSDFRRRADGHHVAAMDAGAGTQIDDQIGRLNGRLVMLDHQHAVAQLFEPAQSFQQHGVVARVQADGRFVEDVANAAQVGAQLRRQANALGLAAGERVGAPVEGQIGQADFRQEIQAAAGFPSRIFPPPLGRGRRWRLSE